MEEGSGRKFSLGKIIFFYFLFLFLILVFNVAYIFLESGRLDQIFSYQKKASGKVRALDNSFECEINETKKIVEGNSMEPFLKNGQEVVLLENYFQCGNPAGKGDLVAYKHPGSPDPLIKIIKATDEDIIEFFGNKIKINGEVMKNSVGEEYDFTDGEVKLMKEFLSHRHIPANTFLIFGDNIKTSTDSREFGPVTADDFLGKFVLQITNNK